jgi:ribosome biogenesis GTPase
MTAEITGLVVATGRNAAWIVPDGSDRAVVAALPRFRGRRMLPVPGDRVRARLLDETRAMLERIEPREREMVRRERSGRRKLMAANVDTIVVVTALAQPDPRLVTLDQLLVFAALHETEALLVFTKPDLADPTVRERLPALYRSLGYPTFVLNPKRGEGLEPFRAAIAGRRALLCGISGVGKSSLFTALGGDGVVGELSAKGLGRQTTTAARLYRTGDGFLIDSPGVNEFGLGDATPAEIASAFPEFAAAGACRFGDCTHLHEPECAVRAAVAEGRIAESRYESYRRLALND